MPEKKGAHLGFDDRREIEDMLKEGGSFREIARKLKVSPTTVSNEVRLNRTFSKPKAVPQKAQARCSRYKDCRKVMLCRACASRIIRILSRCFLTHSLLVSTYPAINSSVST